MRWWSSRTSQITNRLELLVKPQEVLSSCALRSKTGTGTRPVQSLTTARGVDASKKTNVEQLHFSHTSISMTFWNGRCKVGASFDKQAAEWWDSRQGHSGPGRCARPPTGRCSLSVATAACLRWRLLLINFRRQGSSASKSTLCWSACLTRTFPHVPLCEEVGRRAAACAASSTTATSI